ncbi:MAG: Holliday junction branch migration protein RuvA [Clostridia bacterium]|nr:Holliday junction branch migration protein RuvA [Clostridia bacterium]
MIEHVRGVLQYKSPAFIVIETGGIGYKISLPLSSYGLLPAEGDEIKINTYLHCREDGLSLYGFLNQEERDFFLLLISISKIGPKSALRMLSSLSPSEFKKAIKRGDLITLIDIPGIGKKTAQRLILELKERIAEEEIIEGGDEELARDALSALLSLGYTRNEARKAINQVINASKEEIDLASLIKEALKYI